MSFGRRRKWVSRSMWTSPCSRMSRLSTRSTQDVMEGGELAAVDKPQQGTAIRHVVRVIPKADGIYTVSATVAVDVASDSITGSYSIPVIVGDGLTDDTPKTE